MLMDRVSAADVVSFDVTGTLLARDICREVDAFRLVHEYFNERSGGYLSADFPSARRAAEEAARGEAAAGGLSEASVSISAIHREVASALLLDDRSAAGLLESELEVERTIARGVPEMLAILGQAVGQGQHVIGVSDTALPATLVQRMLEEVGAAGITDLFLSNETRLGATDGSLWALVAEKYAGRRIVHLGHPSEREAAGARAAGVEILEVTGPVEAYCRPHAEDDTVLQGATVWRHLQHDGLLLKNVHRSVLNAVIAHWCAGLRHPSDEATVGYGALGPFLVGFVQWLQRTARSDGRRELCFTGGAAGLLEQAYRAWWGDDALHTTVVPDDHPGAVPADGGTVGLGSDTGADVMPAAHGEHPDRAAGVGRTYEVLAPEPVDSMPEPAPESESREAPPVERRAFVDGSRPEDRALLRDLCASAPGALAELLSDAAGRHAIVGGIQQGALSFVADFAERTAALPSTVRVVEREVACENLVLTLRAPTARAGAVLARVATP